jgi:hypothetical protein
VVRCYYYGISGFGKTSCSQNINMASKALISQPTHSNFPCCISVYKQNIASQYKAHRKLSRYVQHSACTAQNTTSVTLLARLLTFEAETETAHSAAALLGNCRTGCQSNWLFVFRTWQFAASRIKTQTGWTEALQSYRDVSGHCQAPRFINTFPF